MRRQYIGKEDQKLSQMLEFESFLEGVDVDVLTFSEAVESFPVHIPDEEYHFLHETAVIVWHGIIFCAWYNSPVTELEGRTPVRGRFSADGGSSWSEVQTIVDHSEEGLLCCPPVFGIDNDELYLFINTMVGADLIHSLERFKFDEKSGKFVFINSEPLPFKLNTNVCTMDNGKLLLPGRIAELDSFPATPAVLISDSGKIMGSWRLVKIQEDRFLPDGAKFIHPEVSVIAIGNKLWAFCRDDERKVPLFFTSEDFGESWSKVKEHDIPFASSKIYSGTLADGRNYLLGNIYDRTKLALFISEPGSMKFVWGCLLQDGYNAQWDLYPQWSYPAAYEWNNKLYVIYSMSADGIQRHRGAMLSIIDLKHC